MGLFGKKPSQEDKDRAANVFAERDKQPISSADTSGVEDRIFGYNKPQGAETLKPKEEAPSAPVNRIDELRKIREERANPTKPEDRFDKQADTDARSAAATYMDTRKNMLGSEGIARPTGPSAEERAEMQRQGMTQLDSVVGNIKNKQFLTDVDAELGDDFGDKKAPKAAAANMDADEVQAATARFRNVGFFTETIAEDKKVLTEDEKLEQDLDELEHAEQAIKSFTNVGFRNPIAESQTVGEEIKEEEEGS